MPVAGKPIIRFIVDKLVEAGMTDFVFVIGYLGDKVRDYIEQTYPDLQTEFVYQEHREGSGARHLDSPGGYRGRRRDFHRIRGHHLRRRPETNA